MSDPSPSPLDQWLEGLGFVHGNPFATVTAEHERSLLPMFFVHVDGYDRARADLSVVVFAPRGCGKSALRVQLASDAAPARPEASSLAVEYTDFDPLIAVMRSGRRVTVDDHLPWLLRAAVAALFTALCGDPDDNSYPVSGGGGRVAGAARLSAMRPTDRSRLARLVRRFAPQLLDVGRLVATLAYEERGQPLREARDHQELRAALAGANMQHDPVAALLAELIAPVSSPSYPETPLESMTGLVRTARAAGFRHVQFLVDRVDEYSETADHPETQADLIESLLAHLPLLELPGASFKFFLAHETRNTLMARPSIRPDRIGEYAVTISWSRQRLKELLDERLSVFSDGAISELIQICAEAPVGVLVSGAQIEHELLLNASGSPRRLLVAGQLMLQSHVQRIGPSGLITTDDWLSARAALLERMPPILLVRRNSRVVRMGSREVELSAQPYKVLLALAGTAGPCPRRELAAQAWGAGHGVSDEAINQAVRRLREALDDDARRPVYVKVDRQNDTIELCHAELE